MPREIHVMGEYWLPGRRERSPLGRRMRAAKDEGDADALRELGDEVAGWARSLPLPADPTVVPVPTAPGRDPRPVRALADAVAATLGVTTADAMVRRHATARLRDMPVEGRSAVVEAGGYEVVADVAGAEVVLVDDVILTGSTLAHVAFRLRAAGAADVVAVVAARTRRS